MKKARIAQFFRKMLDNGSNIHLREAACLRHLQVDQFPDLV